MTEHPQSTHRSSTTIRANQTGDTSHIETDAQARSRDDDVLILAILDHHPNKKMPLLEPAHPIHPPIPNAIENQTLRLACPADTRFSMERNREGHVGHFATLVRLLYQHSTPAFQQV